MYVVVTHTEELKRKAHPSRPVAALRDDGLYSPSYNRAPMTKQPVVVAVETKVDSPSSSKTFSLGR